jgi:ATP-dependent helicase/DNAse subunit B
MALQKEYKMFAAPIEVEEEQAISIPRASGQKKYSITSSDTLQHPEKLKLREQVGGAALLNEQSACPFKAFAHFQLGLRPMVQQDAWLNQKLKGIAIHRILEKIWQELKSQSALLSLSDPDLKALVHKVIFDVITNLSRGQQFFLPDTLAQLEIQRLQKLILLWLSLEKQRPDFTVIALEQKSFAYLGSLVVKLRIDRVDALASGQQIVIDYKTGVVNVKDWFSTPMKDMQLPLYLLSSQAQGALLAQVNVDPKFSGVVQEDIERFGEVKYTQAINSKNLADTEEAWKKIMMALADDIAAGRAHVSPQPGACDYCDLQAVCRIKERGVASC